MLIFISSQEERIVLQHQKKNKCKTSVKEKDVITPCSASKLAELHN